MCVRTAVIAAFLLGQAPWAVQPGAALAGTVYWSSGAGTTDWATGSNWDGGAAPADDLTTDVAGFKYASYANQPGVGAARSVAGILMEGTSAAVTVGGSSTLTLGAGGITVNSGAGVMTISAPLALGASQSWTTSGTSPFTVSGTIDLGSRALTLGGTSNQVLSGVVSGSGGSLVKTGSGTLTLNRDNPSSGAPNTFDGGIRVFQGIVQAESPAMGAANAPIVNNPLGAGTIRLSGGQLYLRVDGDNSSTNRDYTYGNALVVDTAPSTINMDRRTSSGGSNRNLLFSSLWIDNTQLTISQGSNWYRLGITGDLLVTGDAVVNAGDMTNYASGRITDAGRGASFIKVGGNTHNILSSANDYSGGTILASGTMRVGSGYGTSATNPAAVAGTGPVLVTSGALATFLASTNFAPGQAVEVLSSRSALGVLSLQYDGLPHALRAAGSGVLAFTGANSQNIDLARLGDGTWSLGSFSGTGGATFTGVLGVGADNAYRLGGAAGTLTLGGAANNLTGSARLEIGRPLFAAGTPSQGTGVVVLQQAHDFTGGATVWRGHDLYVENTSLGTGAVHVFGNLIARGANGRLFDAANNPLAVNLYGGSMVRLDNGTANNNRWANAADVALHAAGFELLNSNVAGFTETIGNVDFRGGSYLYVTRAGNSATLDAGNLSRQGRATLYLRHTSGRLGTGSDFVKISVDNGAAYAPGGSEHTGYITRPYVYSYDEYKFVTYNTAADSFQTVPWTSGATLTSGWDNNDLVEIAQASPYPTVTVNADRGLEGFITNSSIAGTGRLTVKSGGIIVRLNDLSIKNPITFGAGGTAEGVFWFRDDKVVDIGTYSAPTSTSGVVLPTDGQMTTSGGLTRAGAGNLRINSAQPNVTGGVAVNQGILELRNVTGTAQTILPASNSITLAGYDARLYLRTNVTNQNWNPVVFARNVPMARIDVNTAGVSGNPSYVHRIQGLTMEGSPGVQGQTFYFTGGNYCDLEVTGAATLADTITFHVGTDGNYYVALDGPITGSQTPGAPLPTISKTGDGYMRFGGGNNTFAAGTTFLMQRGTWEVRGAASGTVTTPLGANDNTIVLEGGTLQLRTNSIDQKFGPTKGYTVDVRGDATIYVDRYAGSGSSRTVDVGSLKIGNDWLTVNQGNSYRARFADVQLGGTSGVAGSAWCYFNGAVSGGSLVTTSTMLYLEAANNTYDGGTVVLSGVVRAQQAGSLGTGDVTLYPGGGLILNSTAVLLAGQKITAVSSPAALPQVGIVYNGPPPAEGTAIDVSRAPTGILALVNGSGGTYNNALDMGALYGGGWFLTGQGGLDGRYTADTLGAGAGNVYRLGGSGGAFIVNRNAKTNNVGMVADATGRNLLTGNNSVLIGAEPGSFATNAGSYRVILAGTNNFTGNTTISRNQYTQLVSPTDGGYSGLSNTTVDVYAHLWLVANGSLRVDDNTNSNVVRLHPGADLRLDSNEQPYGFARVNNVDRWADNVGLTLDGARLYLVGYDGQLTTEVMGEIAVLRNASIHVQRTGTAGRAELTLGGLTRGGAGDTLTVFHSGQIGAATNYDWLKVSSGPPSVMNGMVAPWIVDGTSNTFLTYGANGFERVTYDSTNLNAATPGQKVDVTAATTLSTNPDVYALRLQGNLNVSGSNNTVTIRSGGLILAGGGDSTSYADLRFLDASDNPREALIFTHARSLYMRGQITADGVTKFGDNYLIMSVDQPNYSRGWTVNAGLLRADTLGGLGTSDAGNTVLLNGGAVAGGGAGAAPTLYFNAATGSPEPATYSMGKTTAVDGARIYANFGGQDDRTQIMGDLDVLATSGPAPAIVSLENTRSRAVMKTGMVTLNADTIFRVNNNGAVGRMSSFEFAGLTATGKTVTKMDYGVLTLPDISGTFIGGNLIVATGPLRVTSNGSLGSATTNATVEANGVLEIAVAGFIPTANLVQKPGSFERWSVDLARGAAYSVPAGVTLQLNTSIMAPQTITLNGGGLEGFLYTDAIAPMALRVVGPDVTLVLGADSFVGQNSLNLLGGPQGKTPNTPDLNPAYGGLQGSPLLVQGAITGPGGLTKVGRDMVTLAGANTYHGNTSVDEGYLRIGRDNALPTGTVLTTRFQGVFDLYGHDQQVGNLGVRDGAALGGTAPGYSGTIVNSAYALNTLTAGNADDYTYNGVIGMNVALTKTGAGKLTLGGANTYAGPTTINQGTLSVSMVADGGQPSHLGASTSAPGNLVFGGGALHYTGPSAATDRSFTLNAAGGAIEVATPGTTLTVSGAGQGAGGLAKTGPGTLVLASHNTYDGATTVLDGALRVTAAGSLRHNGSDKVLIAADPDKDFSTPGARLIREIANNQLYDGLGSQITAGGIGTRADILKGTNTSGANRDLTMAWREPRSSEPTPSGFIGLVSDVLDLSGMVKSGAAHGETDPFVLTMTYDPALLVGMEDGLAAAGGICLAWLDPVDGWENAVLGNFGGTDVFAGLGPWTDFGADGDLTNDLGRWGIDPSQNYVWAVVNHNSEFAVMGVPEPATWLLMFLGGGALYAAWRRRNRRP